MLRAAIIFFVIGLISFAMGSGNIAGLSIELGRILLMVFLFLSVMSFLITLFSGKKTKSLI